MQSASDSGLLFASLLVYNMSYVVFGCKGAILQENQGGNMQKWKCVEVYLGVCEPAIFFFSLSLSLSLMYLAFLRETPLALL